MDIADQRPIEALDIEPDEAPAEERGSLGSRLVMLARLASMPNAAKVLDEGRLAGLGQTVVREYNLDRDSRHDWEKSARRAMDIAKQKRAPKSEPWPDASNVRFPILATAALQFAARAYPAIVDGPRIVKCTVLGADPDGTKAGAADRVSQHMSYQLLCDLPEWEADMDACLHQIPIVGCAFRKVYEDSSSPAGMRSDLVSAFDLVVNQTARSLESVPRITHVLKLYPHEIGERMRSGRFLDVELKNDGDSGDDEHSPHTILEQHRYFDFDEDGVLEPWIVTVHERTQKVLRLVPGFSVEDITFDGMSDKIISIPRKAYFIKIPFVPDPEGGFYDIGFGRLLEPLADVIDTTLNQMMDAGTLQNAGGGFIGAGVDIGKGKSRTPLRPGEYRTVQTAGPDLRAGIVNMEHPGPSPVLFQLLSLMIDAGKDIAAIQDILVGDMPRNQTATTTMAMIEQGLKVFTAIYKRVFRALKSEYKIIFEINKRVLDTPRYIALLDVPVQVAGADYQGQMDVMPTADPSIVTDMQRMSRAQFLLEIAGSGNPHINVFEATRRVLEAARIERIEEVLVPPAPNPQDEIAVEDAVAGIDLKKAQTVKTVADAKATLAQIGIPAVFPEPVGMPQFSAGPMMGEPPMAAPMEGEMPPVDMGFAPQEAELPMVDPTAFGMGEEPMSEIEMQIAAEAAAAQDAMPGDGFVQ